MRSRSESRSPMARRSESTAARSSRSLAVSGQVPRATSTVNTSTATPSSPLTLAARTSMPLRARAPATEENRPGRSGAATMTWGGWSETEGSPVPRTSAMRSRLAATMRSGAAGSVSPCSTRSVRSTRSATRPAFQAPQADGPVALLSASVSAASRCSVSRLPAARATRAMVVGSSRSRRVAVSGSRRWWRTRSTSTVDVGGREPHPRGDAVDHLHADRRVVAGESLADVVQEGADEEEVGPLDRVGELGGQRGRLEEMTVDGEGVVGVALGLVADGRPLGDEPDQQAVLVERLDLVDGGAAQGEQGHEGRARLVRPGVARRRHAVGQSVQRALGDGPVRAGRRWPPGAAAARRRRRPAPAA